MSALFHSLICIEEDHCILAATLRRWLSENGKSIVVDIRRSGDSTNDGRSIGPGSVLYFYLKKFVLVTARVMCSIGLLGQR